MPPADLLAGLKAEDVDVTLEPNIGEHGPRSALSRPGSNRWPIWVERIEPNALKQAAVPIEA